MEKWFNSPWNKVLEDLEVSLYKGLSETEIESRREKYGKNYIEFNEEKLNYKSYLRPFMSTWIIFLILSLIYNLFFSMWYEVIFILLSLTGTLYISYREMIKSQKEIKLLQSINGDMVKVLRDSVKKNVLSDELVVGDIVFLSKNDTIPCDIRLIDCEELMVDERNLTGDDSIIEKYETMVESIGHSISDIKNMLFMGGKVVQGYAKGIAVSVGSNTEIGKHISFVNSKNKLDNVITQSAFKIINFVINIITISSVISSIIINYKQLPNKEVLIGTILTGSTSFGIFVGMIMFSILYKEQYKSRNISIKKLSIIENIKKIDLLFMDKVGAITEEKLICKKYYTDDNIYFSDADIDKIPNFERLITIGILANNGIYNISDDSGKGNNIDVGILRYAALKGYVKGMIISKNKRIFDVPYDSEKKIYTTVNKVEKNHRANVKGSVDEVLYRCKYIMRDGIEKEICEEDIENIKKADLSMSSEGLTTVALAYRSFYYEPSPKENIESNLVFVGLIGFENIIIPEAYRQINILKKSKIVPLLFTDDNKITATALAAEVGIVNNMEQTISGVEFDALNEEEKIQILSKVRVFSRFSPEQRCEIISSYIDDGYNTAVMGDKLIDLPYVSKSKVSFAVKNRCSNIIKNICDAFIETSYIEAFITILRESLILKEKTTIMLKKISLWIITIQIVTLIGYLSNINESLSVTKYLFNLLVIPILFVGSILRFEYEINDNSIVKNYWTIAAAAIISLGLVWRNVDIAIINLVLYGFMLMDFSIAIGLRKLEGKIFRTSVFGAILIYFVLAIAILAKLIYK